MLRQIAEAIRTNVDLERGRAASLDIRDYIKMNYINGKGSSVKRNPLLAQLMYYVEDIESFGTGIRRIYSECSAAGVRVEFEIRTLGFAVVFYRPEIHTVSDVNIGDRIFETVGVNVGANNGGDGVNVGANNGGAGVNVGVNSGDAGVNVGANNGGAGVNVSVDSRDVGLNVGANNGNAGLNVGASCINVGANVGINETQLKIINLLSENPYFTAHQLSELLGITKRRIESNLRTLREMKLLERVGATKNGYWVVKLPGVRSNSRELSE